MSARNGKIARLPRATRDELNRRLECSDESPELLDWLNALPEVQAVLKERFDGSPINKQNLSAWRLGGFQEALARRDLAQDAQDLAELSREMKVPAIEEELADHAAVALAVRLGALVANWNGEVDEQFSAKAKIFAILGRTVAQLQRQIHEARRENAAIQAHIEQKEKAKTQERREHAVRRRLEDLKGPGLASEAGTKAAAIIRAIRRGDHDEELKSNLSPTEKPWSVKVNQGDLERLRTRALSDSSAAKVEHSEGV